MAQASKRKRNHYKEFRAVNLVSRCQFCGKKLRPSTQHHWLCNDCWHKKRKH